jgi:hypothetical protein
VACHARCRIEHRTYAVVCVLLFFEKCLVVRESVPSWLGEAIIRAFRAGALPDQGRVEPCRRFGATTLRDQSNRSGNSAKVVDGFSKQVSSSVSRFYWRSPLP